MIDYGAGPAVDELEVSLFGPGFGEAIAVHLGENNWLLIDSCLEPDTKRPAAQIYLERIRVGATQVRAIVASHWHDDHVRGLSELAACWPAAELQISAVFSNREARAFLAAYNERNAAPKLTRGTKELFDAVANRDVTYFVHQRHEILDLKLAGGARTVSVKAFSPTQAAFASCIARMASYIPGQPEAEAIGHAPELGPNYEAVVVHVDWGGEAVLLGADMQDHSQFGWGAIVNDAWCSARRTAGAYKASHHGSSSGDNAQIWTSLLQPLPVVFMTPFNWGRHRLPTNADRKRIKALASRALITSGASRRSDMESEREKRLKDICTHVSRVNSGFGAVRLRKRLGDKDWRLELFGNAQSF
jgi:hypothetical protein